MDKKQTTSRYSPATMRAWDDREEEHKNNHRRELRRTRS